MILLINKEKNKKIMMSYVYPQICLTRKGNTTIIEVTFLGSGCGRVVQGAGRKANRMVLQCIYIRLKIKPYIYIYIYIRLKIKPISVRIRLLSCQMFVLPSTGFEFTPLIHCSTSSISGPYSAIDPYVKPFLAPQLCSQP